MDLQRFDNVGGEAIISFLPCITHGPELDADRSRWYHHLLVSGERLFQYGAPCGTCGIVFGKLRSTSDRLDDGQVASLLGTLETIPAPGTLRRLGKILEPGTYLPVVLEGSVERVSPGDGRDYFSTDAARLFGFEPPEYKEPFDPGTAYYRFGPAYTLERSGRMGGPHAALLTSLIMPLHDPEVLSADRVAYWKARSWDGLPLTALAVSVLDAQAPAMEPADPDYEWEEHIVFTHCLLDGHHRVQAAAELGASLRILSFVAPDASLVLEAEIGPLIAPFRR